MTDYASWKYGGTTYPLVSPGVNSLLLDADPALYYALDFFQSVLTTYVGPRLIAEAAKSPAVTQITQMVGQVVPYDPSPFLVQMQTGFPILAVYRVRDTLFEDRTIAWPHRVGEWAIQYVLPVLNAAQMERIWPILKTIGDVIHDRTETMFDPSYAGGARPWALAGLESIKLMSAEFGRYEAGDNLFFPTWKAKIEVKERVGFALGELGLLTGVDPSTDLASVAAPLVSDVADNVVTFIDPTTLPGIVSVWLPDNAVLAADAYHVASITDPVTGNTLAQATAANQPQLLPATFVDFKGVKKSTLRFDGSLTSLTATVAGLANDSSRTIVAFARVTSATTRSSIVAQTLTADTGAHSLAIEANTAGTAGSLLGVFAGGSSYDTTYPTTSPTWHVLSLQITATSNGTGIAATTTMQVDGSTSQALALKSGTGNWQGMSTANQIVVGAIPGIANTNAAMDIGPVLVFNATLTTAQLATVVAYCKQWAGLSSLTPFA